MAHFTSKAIYSLIVLLAALTTVTWAHITPVNVLKYSGCGSPKGLVQYYQRQPRHALPLSPCALRNNHYNYGIPPPREEGPWKLPLPLNTPCSGCSSHPAPQPTVLPTPPITPCSQHVPPTVPSPPCGDSYLFSCQPNIVPVPCHQ